MNENTLFISEFDAESRLRDPDAYTLPIPGIFAGRSRLLTDGMDALVLTMADAGDTVVTMKRLPEAYMDYWSSEICPVRNYSPGEGCADGSECSDDAADPEHIKGVSGTDRSDDSDRTTGMKGSIYLRLQNDPAAWKLLKSCCIQNYAPVPDYYVMCDALGIESGEPPLDVIRKLSSKTYSNELKHRLDLPAKGLHIGSPEEYESCIYPMLESCGRVLIKDSMGVSGKGMLLIDSRGIADRLGAHFRRQKEQGRTRFDFILEPLLDKKADFSCLLTIEPNGRISIDGLQKNMERGYAYLGTEPLKPHDYEYIKASGYFDAVTSIARDMAAEGYHGYVCIDSMITSDGSVIPLIEINPRMSMSRFSLRMRKLMEKSCVLSYTEEKSAVGTDTGRLLDGMDSSGLLYTRGRGSGVIPLAPCTWDDPEAEGRRVRIYYIIVYDGEEEREKISAAWLTHCSGSICSGGNA